MALAAGDLLAAVIAAFATDLGGFHRLAVDDGGTGTLLPTFGLPRGFAQGVVNPPPSAVQTPQPEYSIDRSPLGEVSRQITPRAARAIHIEDGIEHLASLDALRGTDLRWTRQQRLNQLPLFVGQITGIMRAVHGFGSFPSCERGR